MCVKCFLCFSKKSKSNFAKAVYNKFVGCTKKRLYFICVTLQLDNFCYYFSKVFGTKLLQISLFNGHSSRKWCSSSTLSSHVSHVLFSLGSCSCPFVSSLQNSAMPSNLYFKSKCAASEFCKSTSNVVCCSQVQFNSPVYDFAYIVCESSIYSCQRFLYPIPLAKLVCNFFLSTILSDYYEIIADDENFDFFLPIFICE